MNRKIGIGVLWNLASFMLSRGATTLFTLLLARLLAPEYFGLIAMLMIVMELAQHFVQSGLGQALIRSKEVSEQDLSTIFYSNIGIALLVYAGIYSIAPWLSAFYSQPILQDMLIVLGLVVLVSALKIVPTAILSRGMQFKSQMVATTTGVVISGITAVFLAWRGAGVWSLVAQSIVSTTVTAFILWYMSGWKPKLIFSINSFKRLFGFGINLLAIGSIRILVENSYVMVIGKVFSAEITGLYFLATKISNMISTQLSRAIQKATFPAMATLQDDDVRLRYKYRQIIQLMMFVVAPVMAMIAALAGPLVSVLLGDKWADAVTYTQLLCIVATLYPLHSLNVNILNVKGRSDLVLKIGLLKNATSLTLLFVMIPFGVFWIIVGQIINSFLALIPNTYYTARLIDYGIKQQLFDISKPIAAASGAAIVAYVLLNSVSLSGIYFLIFVFLAGLFSFVIFCRLLEVEAFMKLKSRLKLL